jgi:hypothetical protein
MKCRAMKSILGEEWRRRGEVEGKEGPEVK